MPKDQPGLRERKKTQTRLSISHIATQMFVDRGFEAVTVADVAAEAGVSVATVFNYFETKEDLFFDREADIIEAHCRFVRERKEGESVTQALQRAFHEALDALPPVAASFVRTLKASPALEARARFARDKTQALLAETIAQELRAAKTDPTPRIVAALVLAVEWMLMEDAHSAMLRNEAFEASKCKLRRTCDKAFELLDSGVRDYGRKEKAR